MSFQGVKATPSAELLSYTNSSFLLLRRSTPTWSVLLNRFTVIANSYGPLEPGSPMRAPKQNDIASVAQFFEFFVENVLIFVEEWVFACQISEVILLPICLSNKFSYRIFPLLNLIHFIWRKFNHNAFVFR